MKISNTRSVYKTFYICNTYRFNKYCQKPSFFLRVTGFRTNEWILIFYMFDFWNNNDKSSSLLVKRRPQRKKIVSNAKIDVRDH